MRPIGIRSRVLLAAMLPVIVVALVLALVYAGVVVSDLELAHHQRSLALARQVASAAEFALFTRNRSALQALVNAANREQDVRSVVLLTPQGDVLVHAGSATREVPALDRVETTREVSDGRGRFVVQPVFATEVPSGGMFSGTGPHARRSRQVLGYVAVELSRESLASRERELVLAGLVATLGGLLFGALIAVHLSRGVTQPILEAFRTIERFGQGDLAARVRTRRTSPLHGLETGINRMAERIERSREELERRIAEATAELRLKKEEAERANNAKSRFLAAASHDLRQPIHALRLFVESLHDEIGDEGRAGSLLRRIRSSIDSTTAMFDALLDISRLEASVIEPVMRDFPVRTLLRRMENIFSPVAVERGLRFSVVGSTAWLRSDPALLDRLLQNLVSNALKYTREGGVVVGCRRRKQALSIEVWDTGPGIAPGLQDAIFEEFFQVEKGALPGSGGFGLGLAIVDRISRLLDHPVRLLSKPGRGSAFSVEVPYGSGCADDIPSTPLIAVAPRFPDTCVAVVDDDGAALDAVTELLSRWGCGVVAAKYPAQLLAALSGGKTVDLLICDYVFDSGQNGIAAIAEIRAAAGKAIPAILITGDTAPERLREARESGFDVLHKPVAPAHLREVMQRLLFHVVRQGARRNQTS